MAATGIRRFLCCAALSASLGFIPAFAAGELDQKPPSGAAPRQGAQNQNTQAQAAPGGQMAAGQTPPGQTMAPSNAPKPNGMAMADNASPDPSKAAAAPAPVPPAPKVLTAKTGMEGDGLTGEASANVRKYCTNIAAAATDARFAWQSKKLQELETQIKSRIAELDAKEAELKGWLDRRDLIAKQARETLVGIYAKMKPENAATQIGALDDDMATAVLSALTPRQASAIFDEITPPERAAKLAGMLANPMAPPADKKL